MSHFESEIASDDLPRPVREGLPAGYRMRADSHYVEQLTSDNPAVQIRVVALSSIEEPDGVDSQELAPLVASIRAVGVVHPLLLTSERGRYHIIAGRKRFHAARLAGLTAIPALVHHVEAAEAVALADADNLRYTPAGAPAPSKSSAPADPNIDVLKQVATHLNGIAAAERLLAGEGGKIAERAALDIVRAHTMRCSWFVEAVEAASAGEQDAEQRQALGALVDALAADFSAESRLTGVGLRVRVDDRAYAVRVNKRPFRLGLLGALFALLPFADTRHACNFTLTASRAAGGLSVDIALRPTLMDAAGGRSLFDKAWTTRPGGWPALLGALALKTAIEGEGGSVSCDVESSSTHIRVNLPQAR